ncbi:hypothetical protein ASPVEDRAFT_89096 [Aspergillus versicolor CBS 583.65]|uniref:Zn(2)-C6 fungal-type domain-containing protein n=1 Tax=Aspergillus versicolor CBS 583.65 TaxID=1036611 RepID=A0A1L9Q264_ASPVE|nr:uncharacterized protein ASPVEDRAFT_89096 [Aspergillus versicolor CBS 583.65]OJJ07865.1 hypothetical protein ASPVEDRAFT_89096 [Aspergillus versicolor CBS 583.65]
MADEESQSRKRRKIRKGTTSCWECKRRKVRCSLVDTPNAVCTACQRRGTKCITQDVADELNNGTPNTVEDAGSPGPARIRTRIVPDTPTSPLVGRTRDAPASAEQTPSVPVPNQTTTGTSQQLYASFPSNEDVEIISEVAAHIPISFYTFITRSYPNIENGVDEPNAMLDRPSAETHPVLLGRYILRIVMILQCLDLKKYGKQLSKLSDAPQLMMKRLAETAIRLVTTHDELLGTVEGIECVMMEGSYQANCGNFRPAWMAVRKAMTLAQAMGIHRPGPCPVRPLDTRQRVDPAFLWYRILYVDRFMCLMMGLPQGSMDRRISNKGVLALDTPMGRLERAHCVIASRILELNEVYSESYPIDKVQDIDRDLQNAADIMPTGWWIVRNMASDQSNNTTKESTEWNIIRLVNQIFHYGLIVQLHSRYTLRVINTDAEQLHNYSQTACVNASREILTRYITLRNSNLVTYTCRVVDFFTISATFLLLITHLRQHARTPDTLNHLGHQRPSDRAMASQAIDNLQKIGWVSQDRIIAHSATLLNRLLDVEAEAAKGRLYNTHSIHTPEEVAQETENGPPPASKGLRFCVPNFGFVRVVPDGHIQKEVPHGGGMNQPGAGTGTLRTPDSGEIGTEWNRTAVGQDLLPQGHQEPAREQAWYAYPGLGADDWTLQGLDMTFFDGLFQGQLMPADGNIQPL